MELVSFPWHVARARMICLCLAGAGVLGCWVPAAGEVLTPLRVLGTSGFHHAGSLSEIVVLSDGKRFVSSSRDGSARLWDLASGRELQRYVRDEAGDMWGIAVLPGENELLTAGGDGCVTRWDLATGKELKTYEHGSTVFRIALRPGGKEFVATDNQNKAILWNLETGEKIQTFKGHADSVYTAAFLGGGERLVTGASDGKVKVWEVESGKCVHTHEEDLEDVYTVQASPDRKHFLTCSADNMLRILSSESLQVIWKHEFDGDVKVACWSPDGTRIATACSDGDLYVFEADTGKEVKQIEMPRDSHTPVAFTVDGAGLLSGGDGMVYRHDVASGERIVPEEGDPILPDGVSVLAVTGDGKSVYAAGSDARIHRWEVESGERSDVLELNEGLESLQVSSDGSLLATGESDGMVRVRDAATGELKREFQGDDDAMQLIFAKDDQWIIAAGMDNKVQVWPTKEGNVLRGFEGHSNNVEAIAVSPDGSLMVTASTDKSARLWDLDTGAELRSFTNFEDSLRGAVFLADGRSFLVAANEPELWGWLAPAVVAGGPLEDAELERLVGELSAENFAVRNDATQALIDRGSAILPMLEAVVSDDPETSFRLKTIRSRIRSAEYEGKMEVLTKFDGDIGALASDPGGRYWAATVGSEANGRVVIGTVHDGRFEILQELCDGHSPRFLSFNGDGTVLATGNRDGSLSLFAVGPPQ